MLRQNSLDEEYLAALKQELTVLDDSVAPQSRKAVSEVVRVSARAHAARFYDVMLEQPNARFYLDQETVSRRLHSALERWLVSIFPAEPLDIERAFATLLDIGAIHARIQIPVLLIMKGFREIKAAIIERLRHVRLAQIDTADAYRFVSSLMDLALAVMMVAYMQASERSVRSDEAFRLFALGKDLAAERERQRAALAEWAQQIFFEMQTSHEMSKVAPLGQSEFGLWFLHRANLFFSHSGEYGAIAGAINMVDSLIERLRTGMPPAERVASMLSIKVAVDRIGSLLAMLFDQSAETDRTRDPLTRLLNKRFLATVLLREIEIQKVSRRPFSLVLFEINKLDQITRDLGLAGADSVIQQTASMLFNFARTSDSVFRMGQGTFLVIRVEADAARATTFATSVADRYSATHFTVEGNPFFDNSLTFAVVEHDGHPDPRHLIMRAERALRERNPGGSASVA